MFKLIWKTCIGSTKWLSLSIGVVDSVFPKQPVWSISFLRNIEISIPSSFYIVDNELIIQASLPTNCPFVLASWFLKKSTKY